jgi:hypothetical protein
MVVVQMYSKVNWRGRMRLKIRWLVGWNNGQTSDGGRETRCGVQAENFKRKTTRRARPGLRKPFSLRRVDRAEHNY